MLHCSDNLFMSSATSVNKFFASLSIVLLLFSGYFVPAQKAKAANLFPVVLAVATLGTAIIANALICGIDVYFGCGNGSSGGTGAGGGGGGGLTPPPADCSSGNACTFTSNPTSILPGGNTTLSWDCPDGTYTSSQGDSNFSTGGALSGSVSVSPSQTTNYTLQCMASAGNTTGTATVTVNQPSLSITASASRVRAGGSDTITWSATNVTAGSCHVASNGSPASNWSGESGSQAVTIQNQTIYTLSCSVPSGPVSQSVTVQLIPQFQEI